MLLAKRLSGRRAWPAGILDVVALGGRLNELVTTTVAPAAKQSRTIEDGVPTSV